MNSFKILLNKSFTSTTQSISSNLQLDNDYYLYLNRNGGGLVNAFNVRGYLNDLRNQQIVTDFFSYLTSHTTSPEQVININSSDQKLSNVFNDYYLNYILSSSTQNTSVIQQILTGTTDITAYSFGNIGNGSVVENWMSGTTRSVSGLTSFINAFPFLDSFTEDESYYIPVYINFTNKQLARYKYDVCDLFINNQTIGLYPEYSGITNAYTTTTLSGSTTADTRIHTLLNCFVDINLETNENVNTNF